MENVIKIRKVELMAKTILIVALTVFFVIVMLLHSLGFELVINILINLASSFLGISGGYFTATIIEKNKEIGKAVRVKNNLLSVIKTEIYYNKTIFYADYIDERNTQDFLDLDDKHEFQTKEWDMFKFKVYTEGIDILNNDGFERLTELYKMFELINLHKRIEMLVTEKNKNEILNYIYNNIEEIESHLRAE
jgi:flagellar motor component MotA